MSRLIARILLSVLMFPLAVGTYLVSFVFAFRTLDMYEPSSFIVGGVAAWTFIVIYWTALWRKSVTWTPRRRIGSVVAAPLAAGAGLLVGMFFHILPSDYEFSQFIGSFLPPVLWLVATVFLWRETPAERIERLRHTSRGTLFCPACGYNLTGLYEARCPECGAKFTLDELVAAQPHRANDELEAT